ncbi:MAG: Hint domain-containing protein [Pseudomonadota bacterium]
MTIQLRQNAEMLVAHVAAPVDPTPITGGMARGTVIRTAGGNVPVEALRPGDRVLTTERGHAVLRDVVRIRRPAYVVRRNSLGVDRPVRDTVVAADQHLTIHDWRARALFGATAAAIPVRRLRDDRQIAPVGDATFFRLVFGAPLTVYANGLETPTGRPETDVIAKYETD